jgi:hypothetical protein
MLVQATKKVIRKDGFFFFAFPSGIRTGAPPPQRKQISPNYAIKENAFVCQG